MVDLKKSWMMRFFIFLIVVVLFAPHFGCSKAEEQGDGEAEKLKATLVYYSMPG